MSIPHVRHISELDPRRRLLHVTAEIHPGELSSRGYVPRGGEFVLDFRRPPSGLQDADRLLIEFEALRNLGYAFLEGAEWSPAELFRRYRDLGRLRGPFRALGPAGVTTA